MGRALEVADSFRARQQLIKENTNNEQKKPNRGFEAVRNQRKTKTMTNTNLYDVFQNKWKNEMWDKFNTRDLMYYFRETANDSGIKYVIANFRIDMSAFKMCISKGHTPEEIITMIEFLFKSEQDYLDVTTITPNIFRSGWVNKIYQDSQLWLNDEYKNEKTKKFTKREWTGDTEEDNSNIGDWGY
jgi:hypothetical protein